MLLAYGIGAWVVRAPLGPGTLIKMVFGLWTWTSSFGPALIVMMPFPSYQTVGGRAGLRHWHPDLGSDDDWDA